MLALIFSGPGATIIVALVVLMIVLLLTISPSLRNLFERKSFRIGKHFEIGNNSSASYDTADVSNDSVARPIPPVNSKGSLEIETSEQDEGQLPLEVEGEQAFQQMMLVAAYRDKDADKIEAAYEKLKSLHDRQINDEHLESMRANLRLHVGLQSGEAELKALEENNPTWTDPSLNLARYYQRLARYDLAREHIETAINRSNDDSSYAYVSTLLADVMKEQGNTTEVLSVLSSAMNNVSEPNAKANILDKISNIHQENKNDLMASMALEHALNLDPSSKDRRFRLAYLYGGAGRNLLALFHYRILEAQAPEYSFALNNLGVLYGILDLPGKKISAWKTAADYGQTYPVGNLAIEFINHGFYDEAKDLLEKVPHDERGEKRVAHAFELLNSNPEKDDTELEAFTAATKIHHKHMLRAVEVEQDQSIQNLSDSDISGTWASDGGMEIKFSISDDGKLNGELFDPIATKTLGGFGGYSTAERETFTMYLTRGGAVFTGTAWPNKTARRRGLLSSEPSNRGVFFVITDMKTIEGFYYSSDKNPTEVVFKKA